MSTAVVSNQEIRHPAKSRCVCATPYSPYLFSNISGFTSQWKVSWSCQLVLEQSQYLFCIVAINLLQTLTLRRRQGLVRRLVQHVYRFVRTCIVCSSVKSCGQPNFNKLARKRFLWVWREILAHIVKAENTSTFIFNEERFLFEMNLA